jgi:hypothetical protein
VLIAIGILALLEIALGVGLWATFNDACLAHERITKLELKVTELRRGINTVADESKISHERLIDDLVQRASEEVDQEIEKARERGRGF